MKRGFANANPRLHRQAETWNQMTITQSGVASTAKSILGFGLINISRLRLMSIRLEMSRRLHEVSAAFLEMGEG